MEDRAGRKAVLLELVLDKTNRQLGGIDRHIEFFEQVRQTADVVLVTVGDEQALDAVPVLEHVGEVRDDQIDTEHIGIREHKAAVNEDHVALALIQRNVLADLAEAAQRADVHRDGRSGHLKMLPGSLDGARGAGPGGAVRQPDRSGVQRCSDSGAGGADAEPGCSARRRSARQWPGARGAGGGACAARWRRSHPGAWVCAACGYGAHSGRSGQAVRYFYVLA